MTEILQTVGESAKYYWQYVIMAAGLFVVVGAILNWEWLCGSGTVRAFGLGHLLVSLFGRTGYRIFIGLSGCMLIVAGVLMLIYWPAP